MKYYSCIILFFFLGIFPVGAIDISIPKDGPTLEALIELHKQMKKNEDNALAQVTDITASQMVTTDFSQKLSNVKQTLNNKMSDANSYLVLASTIMNVTSKLESLAEEYANYVKNIGPIVVKKPYCAENYSQTQIRMAKEVKRLTGAVVSYTAAGMNLLKASNDERFNLLSLIDSSISNMRSMISSSASYIRYSTIYNFNTSLFDETDIRKSIADELIKEWSKPKHFNYE